VGVNILDCDFNTAGDNDSVKVMIIPLLPNENPCNPISIESMQCAIDTADQFEITLNGLVNDQDYLLVLGSNHDTLNGPCEISIDISGTGVEIIASVENLAISLGETTQLLVEGADSTSSINWSPPEFLDDPSIENPLATPEVNTVFEVSAEVGSCNLKDYVSVKVGPPVDPFSAFSPNNDGVNETWKIKKIEVFPNCQIEVFDRWGQSVFKSIGYEQPWDGTNAGKPLPTAPYYYVIELNSIKVTIPPITGVVSLFH
jgi:gliding motility-associated-like protein